jgi:hypothetical protein
MVSVSGSHDPDLLAVARALLLDHRAGAAAAHLRARGVPSILLKGPAIATWLYDVGEVRPYKDVDLLVPPGLFRLAIDSLADLGYVPRLPGAAPAELGPMELDLIGPANVCIDLHSGLIGVSVPPALCFEVLARHTTTFRISGATVVQVLDVPARAMHLALHAAQNGPIDVKALADLERGLARVSLDDWLQAAALAEEIGATEAFAAALRLLPPGHELAGALSLSSRMSVELALRIASAPQEAIFFERLAEASGLRRKLALIARKIFPTAVSLKDDSAVARLGRIGLLGARLWRPVSLARRLPAAYSAWRKARRATN